MVARKHAYRSQYWLETSAEFNEAPITTARSWFLRREHADPRGPPAASLASAGFLLRVALGASWAPVPEKITWWTWVFFLCLISFHCLITTGRIIYLFTIWDAFSTTATAVWGFTGFSRILPHSGRSVPGTRPSCFLEMDSVRPPRRGHRRKRRSRSAGPPRWEEAWPRGGVPCRCLGRRPRSQEAAPTVRHVVTGTPDVSSPWI